MSTNRELLFKYKKEGISDAVIYFALEECNGFDHLLLSQNLDKEIKDENRFVEAMNRYINGEMIEYVFNKAYFLSKPFYVDSNVLIPRQETEQLVLTSAKLIREMFGEKQIAIADVCTGSGAIGISIAEIFKNNKVILTDISNEVLNIAEKNGEQLSNISYMQGDMLEPLIKSNTKVDVILCNPPYIEDISTIDEKTWKQEPHLALLATPCTLFYEKVFKDFRKAMNENYLLAFEIGEDMEEALTRLAKKYCEDSLYCFEKDIYNKTRFLFIKKAK